MRLQRAQAKLKLTGGNHSRVCMQNLASATRIHEPNLPCVYRAGCWWHMVLRQKCVAVERNPLKSVTGFSSTFFKDISGSESVASKSVWCNATKSNMYKAKQSYLCILFDANQLIMLTYWTRKVNIVPTKHLHIKIVIANIRCKLFMYSWVTKQFQLC